MSQYGARGRANDGQTYQQILGHYYSDTTIGTIDADLVIRVQLAYSYRGTARIRAREGDWSSASFKDATGARTVFPVDSYVQLQSTGAGWVANVFDVDGNLLASATTNDLFIEPADATTLFEMKWRDRLPKYDLYRGAMHIRVNGGGVMAVNHVSMDEYVKGVVPAEMPPLWPIEAVKSQAVAARSYAYVRLRPTTYYDVRPTADNQVYGGVRIEHWRANVAVDATANQVVMYHGQPANTYFFTTAGGHTESNEYAWVTSAGRPVANPIGYLRGVPDVNAEGLAYDRYGAHFSWHGNDFTWEQLENWLNDDSRTRVGNLLDIDFERGVSGRIYRVTITGSAKTVKVSGQILKAIYNSHRPGGEKLESSMFWLERVD
jgi:stage II sporulation protein D